MQPDHHLQDAPAPWVQKYSELIAKSGQVLDLACGGGRHSRYFLGQGYRVVALDQDVGGLGDLANEPKLEIVEADLENGQPFPLAGRQFSGIVVVNYLYRPIYNDLVEALAEGGVLIYQTFMRGNEKFGRPRNPDFLLKENELVQVFSAEFAGRLDVIAFEQGYAEPESPAASPSVVQKICAVKR